MQANFRRAVLLAVCAAIALPAQAHRAWILPAATVLSSEDPWVTFDAAISNDIFHADYHAMELDGVIAMSPDGKDVDLHNTNTGKHRSNFDLQLSQKGTYKVTSASSGLMASWQQDGERKRWRGDKQSFAADVPKNAEGLEFTEYFRRIETFVTAGAPTDAVFKKGENNGLTLMPQTHPNDLYAGEKATFQLLIDGKPAKNAEVEVVPAGMRYRDQQDSITAKTDAQGNVTITWPAAGMYWFSATIEDNNSSFKSANTRANRHASYAATFEVLPM